MGADTMFKDSFWLALLGIACLQTPAAAQTGFANIVDHLHLAAPDPQKQNIRHDGDI